MQYRFEANQIQFDLTVAWTFLHLENIQSSLCIQCSDQRQLYLCSTYRILKNIDLASWNIQAFVTESQRDCKTIHTWYNFRVTHDTLFFHSLQSEMCQRVSWKQSKVFGRVRIEEKKSWKRWKDVKCSNFIEGLIKYEESERSNLH